MKKVAVFGKPGSGKSTLSQALAEATGLPLYPLDQLVYSPDGHPLDRSDYDKKHREILSSSAWIIDGLGPLGSFFERLEHADTLVYLDLPYSVSYWLVTKRMMKGLFVTPPGWPKGSNIFKGSMQSYAMLRLSPTFWNRDFRKKLEALAEGKSLHIVQSLSDARRFVEMRQAKSC